MYCTVCFLWYKIYPVISRYSMIWFVVVVHVNLSYSCGCCKAFEFWRLLEKNASSTQFQLMGHP